MSDSKMNVCYKNDKILIELALTDENLLEAHGFMTEINSEAKKSSPALSEDLETGSNESSHQE